jgi:DNA-binding CsgD family transcriptional regulator/Tol biopolymer transport system component
MGKRGRPPPPDIQTPREWAVLALLREGLTNEQIAERLGVTVYAAKYHVSEILSKLGAASREEAAAWQPDRGQAWQRLLRAGVLLKAAGAAVVLATAVGLGVLAWGVLETSGDGDSGSVLEPGTSSPTVTAHPTLPPLSPGRIIFWRNEIESSPGVYQINPDGSGLTLLFEGSTDGSPARGPGVTSPDQRWVAYVEGSGSLGYYGKLYVSRADGSDLREVAAVEYSDALPPCRVSSDLEWSPDSETLAYYSDTTGMTLYDPESGEIVDQFFGTSASWSPDSSSLVATVVRPLPTSGIVTAGQQCAVTVRILASGEMQFLAQGMAPVWSPNGALIAFSRDGALLIIRPDGTDERRLFGYGDLPAPTVTPFGVDPGALTPRWSPDGRQIAVAIDGRLLVIDVATGESRVLAEGDFPEWSGDGNWLVYWGAEDAPGAIPDMYGYTRQVQVVYLIPAHGTLAPVRLAEGERPSWSP